MRVGVLAAQGAFIEHEKMLRLLGVETVEVRLPEHLEELDGLVIPGGESTTIGQIAREWGLWDPIIAFAHSGRPVWGTCAGMILMASEALGGAPGQSLLGLMDVVVGRTLTIDDLFRQGYEAIFIGTILTATSVSISAQTLMELKAIRSKEGVTILGAAVIDDVLGIILLSFVIAFKPTGGILAAKTHLLDWVMELLREFPAVAAHPGPWRIGVLVALMFLFIAIAILLWRLALIPFMRHLSRQPVAEGLLAAALIAGVFYAWMAEFIGNLAAITGSYFVGVLIAQSDLREQVTAKVHTLTYGMFVSIFFVSIGLEANARGIFAPLLHLRSMTRIEWLMLSFALLIVLVAVLTKVGGCLLGAKAAGFSWLESYRVGVGMISRGEVGLIVAAVGFSAGVIGVEVFSMMILMVLVTTLVTPIWLRAVIPPGGKDDSEGAEKAAAPPTD